MEKEEQKVKNQKSESNVQEVKVAAITYRKTPVANGTLVKVIKAALSSRADNEQSWDYYVSKGKDAILAMENDETNGVNLDHAPAVIVPVYGAKDPIPTKDEVVKSTAIGNMKVIMDEIGLVGKWVCLVGNEAQQQAVSETLSISSEFVPMGILTLGYPELEEEGDNQNKKKMDKGYRKKIHFVDALGRY